MLITHKKSLYLGRLYRNLFVRIRFSLKWKKLNYDLTYFFMYKVSIIMPIYNVEKYISVTFLSILNQSFDSIEYILIDDCCTDNIMTIVQNIISKSTRRNDIKVYKHINNRGVSAARNTGLSKATGKYIFFMDSDDEISEKCIEIHYNTIIKKSTFFYW